jgi:hypothetical protein
VYLHSFAFILKHLQLHEFVKYAGWGRSLKPYLPATVFEAGRLTTESTESTEIDEKRSIHRRDNQLCDWGASRTWAGLAGVDISAIPEGMNGA